MLRQPASEARDAAVRWRQLVDLIARAGPTVDPRTIEDALDVIRADAPRIEEPLRAAAARAIAALPLPLGLLQCFVADRLSVSAPILAATSLDPAQWSALLDLADDETRRFVATIHPELKPPEPSAPRSELIAERDAGISALIARIGRKSNSGRDEGTRPGASAMFRWECGASGEISWVEGVPRGALIGRSIAKAVSGGADVIDSAIPSAFAQRAPFREARVSLAGAGAAAGDWKMSGDPAFDDSGRFAGYRGVSVRDGGREAGQASSDLAILSPAIPLDGDMLRELVHEIKTPLNAIIGFSEIIDGQYLGPAGRRYRARANDVAAEARILLQAITDLDLAAQSQSLVQSGEMPSVDLAACVRSMPEKLSNQADARGINLSLDHAQGPIMVAVSPAFLERLVERVLGAVIDLAVNGETMRIACAKTAAGGRLVVGRPLAMTGRSDADADPASSAAAGLFPIRLARGLARIAGGDIRLEEAELRVDLPLA